MTRSSKEKNYYSKEIDDKYIVRKGDILISWSGTLGLFEWEGFEAVLNQHIFKVVFDKRSIDKVYFKYAVRQALLKSVKNSHGSTMKHLTKKNFDNIEIYYPDLREQEEISKKLLCLDSLLHRRRNQVNELDNLVKSRFNEMFLEMNFPREKLGNLVEDVRYGTSLPATPNGKYGYLRMNNITETGKLNIQNLKYIDVPEKDYAKCVVKKGDVLFNRTNSIELVGKTCVYELDYDMIIAGYIIRVRTKQDILKPIFLSSFLNLKSTKNFLRNIAKGAVNQAHINAKELQKISIPLPPLPLQNEFPAFVKEVDKSKFICGISQKMMEKCSKIQYNRLISYCEKETFMGNFEFLLKDKDYQSFAQACIEAERSFALSTVMTA